MTPRKILAVCNGDSQEQAAIEFAIDLAKAHGAFLECWNIAPDPHGVYVPSAVYGGMMVYPEIVASQMEKDCRESAEFAREMVSLLSRQKKFENVSFKTALGDPEYTVATQGRMADLIVMGRTGRNINFPSLINGALFGSGRPVLLVPPDKKSPQFNGNILVAWNGSREAVHAVSAAMPYMVSGKVWILAEKEDRDFPLTAHDLAAYLKLHGIEADILLDMDSKNVFPGSILKMAKSVDAGLIVMGGWGHTRLREYLLGGATRYIIENADIPVFMAH